MTPEQIWGNIVAYALQVGLVVGLGASLPVLFRVRMPRLRLLYWQVLLVACLALPWVRTWRQEVVIATAQVSSVITNAASVGVATPVRHPLPLPEIALGLLALGIVVRLLLLGFGLFRLRTYRERGWALPPEAVANWAPREVSVLLSDDVAGPVTFGWREPVVLLPSEFPTLPDDMQCAILCHELLHVERHDWLCTIGEELVRAVLWFHPAVWWVIGEIQLAREQTVDRAVIETTRAPEPYVDALLLMAGAARPGEPSQFDLAAAPMFLRRRHLKRRLIEAVKEECMPKISRIRLMLASGAALALLAAGCWFASGTFPLSAAPQVVDDAAGVSVNLNGSPLLHRSPVPYPADAQAKGVEGTVVVQMNLDANGEVSDAAVLSGPDELRKSVLQSVLTWHFDKSAALTTRVVNIGFEKPTVDAAAAPAPVVTAEAAPPSVVRSTTGKVEAIVITGISDQARDALLARLPVHVGDTWSTQSLSSVTQAARNLDSHLTTVLARNTNGNFEIRIGTQASGGRGFAGGIGSVDPLPPGVYSVGNGISPPAVISKVDPEYSEEARKAKYSGSVVVSVVVGIDGRADQIGVVKSLGMGLDEKAVAAVQQWRFRPGVKDGNPVPVRAMIEVNFRLLDDPALPSVNSGEMRSAPAAPLTTRPPAVYTARAGNVSGSDVYSVGNGTTPPRVITKVDPGYTVEARAARLSGSVMLSVVVNTDGRAENISVVKSLGMGLDEMAVACLQQWAFQPGTNQGVPVKVRAQVEINFRLLDKE